MRLAPDTGIRLAGRRTGAGRGRCTTSAASHSSATKNLAVGEGGLVVTNRADVADRLRRLRSHGMTTLTWERDRGHAGTYDVTAHGFNYRFDELRGAGALSAAEARA